MIMNAAEGWEYNSELDTSRLRILCHFTSHQLLSMFLTM